MASGTILFWERQRFRQFGLWVVVLGMAAIFWAGFVYQGLLLGAFGHNLVVDVQLTVLLVLAGVGMPVFFYRVSLTTVVVPGEVRIRIWPFHLRQVQIPLHLVRDYKRITYNPIGDYGGWGIRWSLKGQAYHMSGNQGVQLYFYHRKPVLIGSQRATELLEAILRAKEMDREE